MIGWQEVGLKDFLDIDKTKLKLLDQKSIEQWRLNIWILNLNLFYL